MGYRGNNRGEGEREMPEQHPASGRETAPSKPVLRETGKVRVIFRINLGLREIVEQIAKGCGKKVATVCTEIARHQLALDEDAGAYEISDIASVFLLNRHEGKTASKQITISLTEKEKQQLEAMGMDAGLSPGQMMTCLLVDEFVGEGILLQKPGE